MSRQRRPQTRRNSRPAGNQNRLRIIGGQWRGRKLEFADLPGLRPTTDRVRETLFNWLQLQVPGAKVVDLFAGSGALGLEALSRGAGQLTLVDTAALAVRQLRDNLKLLQADADVVQTSAEAWIGAQPADASVDLVFLDPPFGQGLLAACCDRLEAGGLLKPDGWIYIEAETTLQPLPVPPNWRLQRSLKAGQASCYLFQRGIEA